MTNFPYFNDVFLQKLLYSKAPYQVIPSALEGYHYIDRERTLQLNSGIKSVFAM